MLRFVRETAQRGALAGGLAGLVVGVDLDDVTHAVQFIAVVVAAVGGAGLADVPARVAVVVTPPLSQPWRLEAP
jgi:ABC-type uncharacterized transport system permease subunit